MKNGDFVLVAIGIGIVYAIITYIGNKRERNEIDKIKIQINEYLNAIKRLYVFKNNGDTYSSIRYFCEENTDYLAFRKLEDMSSSLKARRKKREIQASNESSVEITRVQEKLERVREAYEDEHMIHRRLSLSCPHGVQAAYLLPHRCSQCQDMYFAWKYHTDIKGSPYKSSYIENNTKPIKQEQNQKALEQRERERVHLEKNRQVYLYKSEHGWKKGLSKDEIVAEIGARYERYIGYLYEIQGYKVVFNGIVAGKKDDSVDIIAQKGAELILIQCKNVKSENTIHIRHIRQFNDKFQETKAKNPLKEVKAYFYSTNDNLSEEALQRLDETDILHIMKEFDCEYPLIKCNIGKEGKRIYHLPAVGQYDRVKIQIKQGECYVNSVEEAEALGFRAVVWANQRF